MNLQQIVQKYIDRWHKNQNNSQMWVMFANPGDMLPIPGVTFGNVGEARAGMHIPVHAELIVLNPAMSDESKLTTFLHEYGHARYRKFNPKKFNEVDSEVEAIRFSLVALEEEGLETLVQCEVAAVKTMATQEPYKSAVAKVSKQAIWQKYDQ